MNVNDVDKHNSLSFCVVDYILVPGAVSLVVTIQNQVIATRVIGSKVMHKSVLHWFENDFHPGCFIYSVKRRRRNVVAANFYLHNYYDWSPLVMQDCLSCGKLDTKLSYVAHFLLFLLWLGLPSSFVYNNIPVKKLCLPEWLITQDFVLIHHHINPISLYQDDYCNDYEQCDDQNPHRIFATDGSSTKSVGIPRLTNQMNILQCTTAATELWHED